MSWFSKTFSKVSLKSVTNAIGKVAGVAAAVTPLGGTLGAIGGSILGTLGGSLGKAATAVSALGATGAANIMDGSATSNALLQMLTGGTSATEAQQEFIKMALQGGMTSDEVAQNKQFRDLIVNQRNVDLQSAEAGLNAFRAAATEMTAAGKKLENVQIDKTGVMKILDQNQIMQNAQLANAQSVVTPTNTASMQQANETQSGASASALGTISKGWGAVKGILSSYGGREVGQGVGGTSLGQAPGIEFGMSKASGVKIGDQTDAARQTLERQIAEAKASGASPAQVAALRQRGELAIQQEAARVNAANEQAGSKAYYDAVSGMTNINQSASGIGAAQAQQEAMIQQLDTAKKQALNDMYNQMITQGLNQADIALRLEQASSALEVQKQQAIATIQSNVGAMNITQYQTALSNAMSGLTQLGVNIGHQLGATSGALNAAGTMVAGKTAQEQAIGAASAGQTQQPASGGLDLGNILGTINTAAGALGADAGQQVVNAGSGWQTGSNNMTISGGLDTSGISAGLTNLGAGTINGPQFAAPMTIGSGSTELKYKPDKKLSGVTN